MNWRCCLLALLMSAFSCTGSSSSSNNDDDSDVDGEPYADWFNTSCAELGGVLSPKGACYVDCSNGSDCPADTVCGYGSAVHQYCKIPYQVCEEDDDCGPQGWDCYEEGSCVLPCSIKTDVQSDECPEGMSCEGSFCKQGTSSGSDCPAGCRHPTDSSICCEPPFCSGDCAGSSCC